MYTNTLYDVKFQHINIEDWTEHIPSGPTKPTVYMGKKLNSIYSNIYFLTNRRKGYRYNLTTQIYKELKKKFLWENDNHISLSDAYLHLWRL
ncbi:MAG: hypothetical protein ABI045_02495 [Flavobacteriales bacterium]